MKKLMMSLVLMTSMYTLNAQFEVKVNPIALIFTSVNVSAEYLVNDNLGLELDALLLDGDGGAYLTAKYYFNPQQGTDRFHVGIFTGAVAGTGIGLGFMLGTKIVSEKGVLFDVGLGLGRATDGILPYGKLAVGYRFGGK